MSEPQRLNWLYRMREWKLNHYLMRIKQAPSFL